MDVLKQYSDRFKLITLLGATAGGKTAFAAKLAYLTDREIISADSRQVYRRMDIGTGKDLEDYVVDGMRVPVHLIDICEPGTKYNVYQYQQDFIASFREIQNRGKNAILCGGSGMYIEAILREYELVAVPHHPELRKKLESEDISSLTDLLKSYKNLHNISDTSDKDRLIRAVEIAEYYAQHPGFAREKTGINHLVLGIKFDRDSRRRRISERLKQRLDSGMAQEVKSLMESGIDAETLIYYGLEYKYLALYLTGKIPYDEMYKKLETAIHQFSKRQMTWFRKMERDGIKIYWIDGYMSMEEKIERVKTILEKENLKDNS
jgi:tRNA dimethylallyltransferase